MRATTWRSIAIGGGCLIVAGIGFSGCAGESLDESGGLSAVSGGEDNSGGGGGASASNGTSGGAPGGSDEPYVPEQEERFSFQAPRSSRNFVFVANTSLDSVAKVDASTLEVVSIEVGDHPTVVRTFRDENLAVVLNTGSDEVSVIRAGDASDYVINRDLPPDLNGLVLAPNGDYALAYYDFQAALEDPELASDAPPFQDVALVRLAEGEEQVFNLTVGFQVLDVEFDEAGERAFIITRTGVSVVQMGAIDADRAIPPVSLTEFQESQDETDREVEITDDGRFAFVRTAGLEGVNVVDLESARTTLVAMSATPTDLDIIPGQSRALAVVRQTRELVIVDLPQAIDDPESVRVISLGDEPAGLAELTPDAQRALVFTSAENRETITVVELESGRFETHPLRKGVRSVAISPSGDRAIIFHNRLPGEPIPGEDVDDFIDKSWGYSLFDISTGDAKLETVPAKPGEFVFSEETGRLYVLLEDANEDVRQVEVIDLAARRSDSVRLGSPPEHVGLIPNDGDPRVYISQEHPVGRMTFIDELTRDVKTVTGYQLNSLIE